MKFLAILLQGVHGFMRIILALYWRHPAKLADCETRDFEGTVKLLICFGSCGEDYIYFLLLSYC